MIYGLEPFDTLYPELKHLMRGIWEEVDQRKDHVVMKPDVENYTLLTETGNYKPYTIRTDDRELIGFIGIFVHRSMHCGDVDAVTDYMYVKPEYRGVGATLLKLIEDDLREEGVDSFSFICKTALDNGNLAKKLDFKLYEQTYQKRL